MPSLADQIHAASLAILADPGIRLHDPALLEALDEKGLRVDGDRVRLNEAQIMASLEAAPAAFSLTGRSPNRSITIGANSRCMAPAYGAPEIVGPDQQGRTACFDDYVRIAKLVQASDLLHLGGGILVQPADLDADLASLVMLYAALCLGDKPLIGIQGSEPQVRRLMELECRACGSEAAFKDSPQLLFLVSTLSPLQIDAQALATLRVCAEYHQPVIISPGLMFGSTGPITPAGSMVQANAEFLAGLCVIQTLAPGLPVVYGCLGSPADLRTGGLSLASPSRFTFKQMATAMAEKYHLPNRGIGAVTDAGQVSVQSGYEAVLTLSSDYQQRTSVILHAAGILKSFSCFSFEQFMVDLEIIRMLNAKEAKPGVDEAALAVNIIRHVGPGGEYLTSPHTLKHCRSLLFDPALSPPRTNDPQALDMLIQKGLHGLENAYTAPQLPMVTQRSMDDYMTACGVPSTLLETVHRARTTTQLI